MTGAPLLVEILTEELPPKSLRALSEAFLQALCKSLLAAGLAGKPGGKPFATPRRLAVLLRPGETSGSNDGR